MDTHAYLGIFFAYRVFFFVEYSVWCVLVRRTSKSNRLISEFCGAGFGGYALSDRSGDSPDCRERYRRLDLESGHTATFGRWSTRAVPDALDAKPMSEDE